MLCVWQAIPAHGATGGPDAFGYTFIDSTEAGLLPNFENISVIGTLLPTASASDDALETAAIGFTFRYYGTDFTSCGVCSNGFISFNDAANNFTDFPIPTAAVPNNIIAAWWDDLAPHVSGDIYRATLGTAPNRRFIVQYQNVADRNASSNLNTFQIKLFEGSNRIEVHYQSMVASFTGSTIGIENATGTVGLQYYRGVGLPVASQPFAVRFSPPGSNTVSTPANSGAGSLRQVVAEAVAGSTILFDPNLSGQTINLTTGPITVDKPLVINAAGLAAGLTINAGNSSRIFNVTGSSPLTLNSLKLTGGNSGVTSGGAVSHSGSSLNLINCTLVGNTSGDDGGAIAGDGGVILENCLVANNQATDLGGAIISFGGVVSLINSTLTGNSSGGPSIWTQGTGALNFRNVTMTGNTATSGNIVVSFLPTLLENSIVAGNSSDIFAPLGITTAGNNITSGVPLLLPLANYGGPTLSMPPAQGSPAIDAGAATASTTVNDQRGFPRVVNGALDIGAVEISRLIVNTTANSGAGSLRQALADVVPSSVIAFEPFLDAATIDVTGTPLVVDRVLAIDASSLPLGLFIRSNGNSRVFNIQPGASAVFDSLDIRGGSVTGATGGGGIRNQGSLTIRGSIVRENTATSGGGGILNDGGTLKILNSSIDSNDSATGGGIENLNGSAELINVTLTRNDASSGIGGGIRQNGGSLLLENCIVEDNRSFGASEIGKTAGTISKSGNNLIGSNLTVEAEFPASSLVGSPSATISAKLGLLSRSGGRTFSRPLELDSPALDAGIITAKTAATDQRGGPRIFGASVDLGAVEMRFGNLNLNGLNVYGKIDTALIGAGPVVFEISTDSGFGETIASQAGSGLPDFVDGPAGSAAFAYPSDVVEDADGNLIVADTGNNAIRLISPSGEVVTIAGTGNFGFTNGDGDLATFAFPSGLALGPDGDVYVADSYNHVIRKLTRPVIPGNPWVVTTFAGTGDPGHQDGPVGSALFNLPYDLTIDSSTGTLHVADFSNNRIRSITSAGVVTTIAGTGAAGTDDGSGPAAMFDGPADLARGLGGALWISDFNNHRIRKLTPPAGTGLPWTVTTIAGSTAGFADGSGVAALFNGPSGLAMNSNGELFVSDSGNHRIRKVSTAAMVSTVMGTGIAGFQDGPKSSAKLDTPAGLTLNAAGELLVADSGNHRIRRLFVKPVTVTATIGSSDATGTLISAVVNALALGLDGNTNYYFRWKSANGTTQTIPDSVLLPTAPTVETTAATQVTPNGGRPTALVNPNGSQTTTLFEYSTDPNLAGPWRLDTYAAAPSLGQGRGMVVDADGNLFVADSSTHKILKIEPGGLVSTFAGSGTAGFADGLGAAARFSSPVDLTIDADGNLYVADELNHRIRKVTTAGFVSTVAGSGLAGFEDAANALTGRFLFPGGIAVTPDGALIYVADRGNHRVRVISAGALSTLAGDGTAGLVNGPVAGARFDDPTGLSIAVGGNLFVADRDNHAIRVITPGGQVLTAAGTGAQGFQDGSAAAAKFSFPTGVAADTGGNLFVADRGNHRLRLVLASGDVTTLAGSGINQILNSPAPGALHPSTAAGFSAPVRLALDPANATIYLTEEGGSGIRRFKRGALPTVALFGSSFGTTPLSVGVAIPDTLFPASTYYFRAKATNARGTVSGSILSFTTPTFQNISIHDGPDLSGTVLPSNSGVPVEFGSTPPGVPVSRTFTIANSGGTPLNVSALSSVPGFIITGGVGVIPPFQSTSFQVRLTASTSGTFSGAIGILSDDPDASSFILPIRGMVFTAPSVTTLDASSISEAGAILNAEIDPNEDAADVWFELSNDPGLNGVDVSTRAGSTAGFAEGAAATARFNTPRGLASDLAGNLYIADSLNHRIRKIAVDGTTSTLAGTGTAGFADGAAATASFNQPAGLALDSDGTLYVCDSGNHRIRAISTSGIVTTHSGTGSAGFTDGVAAGSRFNAPAGLVIDSEGNLYVADQGNHRVRKIAPNGSVATLAGAGSPGFLNGAGATALFNSPLGIACAGDGTVYLTETGSTLVRRITPGGFVDTFVSGSQGLSQPTGLAIDPLGRLFVADRGNHRIRSVSSAGLISTLAGTGTPGLVNGPGAAAAFNQPFAITASANRDLLVGELTNSTIRRLASSQVLINAATGLVGTSPLPVSAVTGPLGSAATYYFRAFSTNRGGTTFGQILSFPPQGLIQPPFVAWQLANFGAAASNPLIAGPLANPSKDGMANLLKYACGADPNVHSLTCLPIVGSGASTVTLTYRKALIATDIAYTVEVSENLTTWISTGVTEEIVSEAAGIRTIRASVLKGTAPRKYLRLNVTQP